MYPHLLTKCKRTEAMREKRTRKSYASVVVTTIAITQPAHEISPTLNPWQLEHDLKYSALETHLQSTCKSASKAHAEYNCRTINVSITTHTEVKLINRNSKFNASVINN